MSGYYGNQPNDYQHHANDDQYQDNAASIYPDPNDAVNSYNQPGLPGYIPPSQPNQPSRPPNPASYPLMPPAGSASYNTSTVISGPYSFQYPAAGQSPDGQPATSCNTPAAYTFGQGMPGPVPLTDTMGGLPLFPGTDGNTQPPAAVMSAQGAGNPRPGAPTPEELAAKVCRKRLNFSNIDKIPETPQNASLLRQLKDKSNPVGHGPISSHAEYLQVLHHCYNLAHDEDAWEAAQQDPTFPRTDAQMCAYVGQLLQAFYDWSHVPERSQPGEGRRARNPPQGVPVSQKLEHINKGHIGQMGITLKCWEVLECAKAAQEGRPTILPWYGKHETVWEGYESFRDRWDSLCGVVLINKQVLHSLTRGPYSQRFANAPNNELRTKVANMKNNDRKAAQIAQAAQAQATQAQAGATPALANPAGPFRGRPQADSETEDEVEEQIEVEVEYESEEEEEEDDEEEEEEAEEETKKRGKKAARPSRNERPSKRRRCY